MANIPAIPMRGFSKAISFISAGMFESSALPDIFCSARIMASGFFVSSTAPASAIYSRFLDKAKRVSIASRYETPMIAMAKKISAPALPPPLRR